MYRVFGVLILLAASPALAAQATSSFSVGITITGTRAPEPAAAIAPSAEAVTAVDFEVPPAGPERDAWLAYCSEKYRSFDSSTGLFLSFEGDWLPCRN